MVAADKPRHFSRLAKGPTESGLEYMSGLTHQSDKKTVHRMKQGFFLWVGMLNCKNGYIHLFIWPAACHWWSLDYY